MNYDTEIIMQGMTPISIIDYFDKDICEEVKDIVNNNLLIVYENAWSENWGIIFYDL